MRRIEDGTSTWMFQYQIDIYDLLTEIDNGARTELWRAAQHRRRMQIGERIYYFRGQGPNGPDYAGIVATGTILSRVMPFECEDCYPWVIDVRFDALVQPPLSRIEIRRDAILREYLPYSEGRQGTQFLLPDKVVLRTAEITNGRLIPLASPSISPTSQSSVGLGDQYKPANEDFSASVRDMIHTNPELVNRANRSHARLQNMLERHLRARGWVPRSYNEREPNFDIAWMQGTRVYVAEVKSLTKENEEMQLRLGLSQVLMYRHRLSDTHHDVIAVLFVEREPTFDRWSTLCRELGVQLTWPETIAALG